MERSVEMPCPQVMIPLEWSPVLNAKRQPADCHTKGLKRTKALLDLLTGPQIYRWVVRDADHNIVAVYIGETGNVRNRLALYRNGHKKENDTVNHVKRQFELAVEKGHTISLDLLRVAPFGINGALITMERLSDPAIRKLLENIALLDARAKGLKVLNRDEDVNVKLFRRLTKTMSASDLSELQHKLQQLAPPTQ